MDLVRWMIRRSSLARRVRPHVEKFVYGKRWQPRQRGSGSPFQRRSNTDLSNPPDIKGFVPG
jgi:hypothetical protein